MRTLTKVSVSLVIFFSVNCWAGPRFALPKESEFKTWQFNNIENVVAVHKAQVVRLRLDFYAKLIEDFDGSQEWFAQEVRVIPKQSNMPQLLNYSVSVAGGLGPKLEVKMFSYFYEMKKDVLKPWRKSWHMVKKCEACTQQGSRLTHVNFLEKKYHLRTDLIWW